jgi:single-stranded DNA-binding protein
MKNFQISGYVGQTPELKTTGDTTYTSLRVAVRTRNNGTDWFWVAVFDKLAEIVAKHVSKGTVVAISGDLRVNEYQGKERVELIADKVDFYGRGRNGEATESADDEPF